MFFLHHLHNQNKNIIIAKKNNWCTTSRRWRRTTWSSTTTTKDQHPDDRSPRRRHTTRQAYKNKTVDLHSHKTMNDDHATRITRRNNKKKKRAYVILPILQWEENYIRKIKYENNYNVRTRRVCKKNANYYMIYSSWSIIIV